MRGLLSPTVVGTLLAVALVSKAASAALVSFTIDDGFPATIPSADGAGVFSDDQGNTVPNEYLDHRLEAPESFVNWCVDAEPFSPGNLFVRLNRKLDGETGTMRCDEHPNPGGSLGISRQFVLKIADATVCDQLADSRTGLTVTDFTDAPWNADNRSLPCTLGPNENPRIRLATLYKSKSRSTELDFLPVGAEGWTIGFEIQSDKAAPIVTAGPTRTVTYTETFRLVKYENGERPRTIPPAFTMPVRMVFTEH